MQVTSILFFPFPVKFSTHERQILCFNSLPNDKILDQSKLKAFVDDKFKVIQMAKFALDKIENIVGKESFLATSIFFFFHNVFKGFCMFLKGYTILFTSIFSWSHSFFKWLLPQGPQKSELLGKVLFTDQSLQH